MCRVIQATGVKVLGSKLFKKIAINCYRGDGAPIGEE